VSGTVGDRDEFTFALNLPVAYDSLTISTCSATLNQFETELTFSDSDGNEIAEDEGSCPQNSDQSQIVLSNVAAGDYEIEMEVDAQPNDMYVLSVSGTVATTSSTTSSTLAPPTTTSSTTSSTTTTTTLAPTNRPTEASDSGSGSDDSSSSDDAALAFAKNVEERESELLGLANGGDDAEGAYSLVLNLDKSSWMNLWGIFALFMVVNALCFAVCLKRKKEQSFGV